MLYFVNMLLNHFYIYVYNMKSGVEMGYMGIMSVFIFQHNSEMQTYAGIVATHIGSIVSY